MIVGIRTQPGSDETTDSGNNCSCLLGIVSNIASMFQYFLQPEDDCKYLIWGLPSEKLMMSAKNQLRVTTKGSQSHPVELVTGYLMQFVDILKAQFRSTPSCKAMRLRQQVSASNELVSDYPYSDNLEKMNCYLFHSTQTRKA